MLKSPKNWNNLKKYLKGVLVWLERPRFVNNKHSTKYSTLWEKIPLIMVKATESIEFSNTKCSIFSDFFQIIWHLWLQPSYSYLSKDALSDFTKTITRIFAMLKKLTLVFVIFWIYFPIYILWLKQSYFWSRSHSSN